MDESFSFGRFRASASRRELWADGAPVAIGARSLDVLIALLRRPGELVTKDELIAAAWAGLTPTVRSSDGKARLGRISRMGSCALRWALIEAAQKSVLGGGPLRQRFERIARRRGRNVAKVAVARQILTLCYYGLRDGEIRCLEPGQARASRAMAASS